jgi:hypothetical protein
MNVDTIINMDEPVKLRGCTNLKLRRLDRVVTRHYARCSMNVWVG